MSNLTAKEEKFATLVALEGYTQHDAYLEAYDAKTEKSGTIDPFASKIASKVATRIAVLRGETVSPKIATLIRRKVHATEVMDDADASRRDQLTANKLLGEYERDFVIQVETKSVVLHATLESLEPEKRAELIELLQAMKEEADAAE